MNNLIAITMGDPKGIGPEIILKAVMKLDASTAEKILIYGDKTIFEEAYRLTNIDTRVLSFEFTSDIKTPSKDLNDLQAAEATLAALDRAISDTMQGKVDAVITAPANKARLNRICADFIGHTEYFAEATGSRDAKMIFIPKDTNENSFILSLVTTHVSIAALPSLITRERVLSTIATTEDITKNYTNKETPSIAVTSLNPHSGENGFLGQEEIDVIKPAIAEARLRGIECAGPMAADSLFDPMNYTKYDAIIAMYHDQGLAPLKALGMTKCVNVTAGLPFIRTSPAHGTAEDIAWKGIAQAEGMISAIEVAEKLLLKQRRI